MTAREAAMSQNRIAKTLREFRASHSGNVATIFGLAVLPVMMFAGAAVDYSKTSMSRAQLQAVVDAVALALVHEPKDIAAAQLQAKAQSLFAGMTEARLGRDTSIEATIVGETVKVHATAPVPTSFMRIAGTNSITIGADSAATFGRSKLQIALALDNTGSMGSAGKMPALKAAVNDMLDQLQAMNASPGDIKVSLVPFNTEVKIGTAYSAASWLRFDTKLENPSIPNFAAVAPTRAGWDGCIADRDQNYDISAAAPTSYSSNYVAAMCHYGSLTPMMPLTADFSAIRTAVNSMTPTGATNVTIGMSTGLATLRADSPFGNASSNDTSVQKFLVLLTDGNNTQNRWGGDGSEGNPFVPNIDDRLRQACAQAASQNVKVFTIRVIDGNAALLQSCASNPSMYYQASSAAEIAPAFRKIIEQISKVRLSA